MAGDEEARSIIRTGVFYSPQNKEYHHCQLLVRPDLACPKQKPSNSCDHCKNSGFQFLSKGNLSKRALLFEMREGFSRTSSYTFEVDNPHFAALILGPKIDLLLH